MTLCESISMQEYMPQVTIYLCSITDYIFYYTFSPFATVTPIPVSSCRETGYKSEEAFRSRKKQLNDWYAADGQGEPN